MGINAASTVMFNTRERGPFLVTSLYGGRQNELRPGDCRPPSNSNVPELRRFTVRFAEDLMDQLRTYVASTEFQQSFEGSGILLGTLQSDVLRIDSFRPVPVHAFRNARKDAGHVLSIGLS